MEYKVFIKLVASASGVHHQNWKWLLDNEYNLPSIQVNPIDNDSVIDYICHEISGYGNEWLKFKIKYVDYSEAKVGKIYLIYYTELMEEFPLRGDSLKWIKVEDIPVNDQTREMSRIVERCFWK